MTTPKKHLLTKAWDAAIDRARDVPGTRPEVWQESAMNDSPFVRVVLVNIDDGEPYEMSARIRTHYVSLYTWAARRYGGKTTTEKRASWRRANDMFERIIGSRFNKTRNTKEVPAEAPLPILKRRGPRPGALKNAKNPAKRVEIQPLTGGAEGVTL